MTRFIRTAKGFDICNDGQGVKIIFLVQNGGIGRLESLI